jgi:hypothetical protein
MRIPAYFLQRNSAPSARCLSLIVNENYGVPITTELLSIQHVGSHWYWMGIPAYLLRRNSLPSARCQSRILNENYDVPITKQLSPLARCQSLKLNENSDVPLTTELRPFSTFPVTDIEWGLRRTFYNGTAFLQYVVRHWYWMRITAYLLQRNTAPSALCQSRILNENYGVPITEQLIPFSALPVIDMEWQLCLSYYNRTPSLQPFPSHWYWMRILAYLLRRNTVPSACCQSRIRNEDPGVPLTRELSPFSTLPVTDTEWLSRLTCYNANLSL